MSEDEECSPEKADGLECFQFQLLLDDFSSSQKKARKASAHDAQEEYFREYENSIKVMDGQGRKWSMSEFDKLSRKNHYKSSEDNINLQFDELPVGLAQRTETDGASETKSECPEHRRSFNIWGCHKVPKSGIFKDHLSTKFEPSAEKQSLFANSDAKPNLRKESEDLHYSSPQTEKKKSLRGAKRDGFYPKEQQSYRKLSYQENTFSKPNHLLIDDEPLDIRVKLNLNSFSLFASNPASALSSQSQKFAQYVQNDVGSLLQMIEKRLDLRIKSSDRQDFPSLESTIPKR
jgi:hypothetical protein